MPCTFERRPGGRKVEADEVLIAGDDYSANVDEMWRRDLVL
jgi:hypothetical protein